MACHVMLKSVLLTPVNVTKDNAVRLIKKHNPELQEGFFFRSAKKLTPALIRRFRRERWVRVFYPVNSKNKVREFFEEYCMTEDGGIKGRLQYYKYDKDFKLI